MARIKTVITERQIAQTKAKEAYYSASLILAYFISHFFPVTFTPVAARGWSLPRRRTRRSPRTRTRRLRPLRPPHQLQRLHRHPLMLQLHRLQTPQQVHSPPPHRPLPPLSQLRQVRAGHHHIISVSANEVYSHLQWQCRW